LWSDSVFTSITTTRQMYDNDICNNITHTRTESDFWCVITNQNSVLYSESGFSKFKSSMLA
jgi:hypothetical protein